MNLTRIAASRDAVGGAALLVIGICVAIYALMHYELGSLNRMGPGMVPVLLGALLAILGGVLVGSSFRNNPGFIDFDLRALFAITMGAVAFALLLETFGLAPAVVCTSLATTIFETRLTWRARLCLAAALAAIAVALFPLALGMHISIARWPL
ncbi:tripartite tricarboxylate transporter TctB family protein [Mesorhizobium sp. CAU 1741]|uniref:tripartite tricarboxylate transporter TctB family protein n=1 Tax=Mesorhizobium sp. CAU 1741 TaxID=3140366 RepID=UPI00325C0D87